MIGQGNNYIPIAPAIKKPNGVSLTTPKDIADSFLDFFSNPSDFQCDYSIEEATLSPIINSHIADNSPNQLKGHSMRIQRIESAAISPIIFKIWCVCKRAPSDKVAQRVFFLNIN